MFKIKIEGSDLNFDSDINTSMAVRIIQDVLNSKMVPSCVKNKPVKPNPVIEPAPDVEQQESQNPDQESAENGEPP